MVLCVVGACALAVACESPAAPEVRALRGGDFVCDDDTCAQRFVALPDDGEWECIDRSGLVICRGGHAAAGVRAGSPDDAFVCGELAVDEEHRRVCVDAEPDLPSAEGWSCRHERASEGAWAGVEVRRCERDASPRLGSPCDEGACPIGLRCVSERCVRASTDAPDCWTDADCEGGSTCVLARCSSPS